MTTFDKLVGYGSDIMVWFWRQLAREKALGMGELRSQWFVDSLADAKHENVDGLMPDAFEM